MKRLLKRIVLLAVALIVVLVAVLVVRTLTFSSRQLAGVEPVEPPAIDVAAAAERLAAAVRLRTISDQDPANEDPAAFAGLIALIDSSYPTAHRVMTREIINGAGLLYTWAGADASLSPTVLCAHTDVVPVPEDALQEWTHPPFSGAIADGFIWGRGTLDDKVSVFGLLEAVEILAQRGHTPQRTLILAFGHDEEVGGARGAAAMAAQLEARGIEPWLVVDEGMVITEGILPVERPVALIGLSEKGYVSLAITATQEGGHSSMPPPRTAAGRVARAAAAIEDNPMPASLEGTPGLLFDWVGPEMGFGQRLVFANRWLFEPLIRGQLEAKTSTNALIRTTIAVTMLQGSPQDNVLPSEASTVVNARIRPGDTIDGVVAHVRAVIADDALAIEPLAGLGGEPTPVSSIESEAFGVLHRTIAEVFPDAIVAPSLMLGASDARHYTGIASDAYRFVPMRLTSDDLPRIHGINERIAVENYAEIIAFYVRLIENLG